MTTIGQFTFPTNREEAWDWKPTLAMRALAVRVLAVARTRVEGKWAAYIDAVPGECHEDECDAVLRRGDKPPEAVARALFPMFDGVPYAD